MFANVSPTCSPCGHVMQPLGSRRLWEKAIGGAPVALWVGQEYECACCRTRTVLVEPGPHTRYPLGSVGYEAFTRQAEALALIPAERIVSAEHLPPSARRDSTRQGGTPHLSQRQAARRLVEDFFSRDAAGALETLVRLAALFELDVPALLVERAGAIPATCETCGTSLVDGACPAPICRAPLADADAGIAPRDADGRILVDGVPVADLDDYLDAEAEELRAVRS